MKSHRRIWLFAALALGCIEIPPTEFRCFGNEHCPEGYACGLGGFCDRTDDVVQTVRDGAQDMADAAGDQGEEPDAQFVPDGVVDAQVDASVPDTAQADAGPTWVAPAPPEWLEPDRVFIAGGAFLRGDASGGTADALLAEVQLTPYFIDRTEVTVAVWAACVSAGDCTEPREGVGCNGSDRQTHPVNCVDWSQAYDFCVAVGGRLPSEAEWERAARGSCGARGRPECDVAEDAPEYPWDGALSCGRAHYNPCDPVGTTPVGQRPAGDSVDGVADLLGNVAEWTGDRYAGPYDDILVDPRRPASPDGGGDVVIRGGHARSEPAALTVFARQPSSRSSSADIGLRCAYEAIQQSPEEAQ